jgi:hypothetical protein
VLPVALLANWWLVRRHPARRPMAGLLSGAGLPLLYIAFLNRGGPGLVCAESAGVNRCDEHGGPWPWLTAGVLFLLAGAAAYVLAGRRGN